MIRSSHSADNNLINKFIFCISIDLRLILIQQIIKMKQIISLLVILTSLTAFNQTVVSYREAILNDSPSYTLDGIAYIEELSNGTFRFRLSSTYATQPGPDVQIFMTNDNNFVSPINTSGALFVEDIGSQAGGISHFSGAYSTILPGISSLSDFDHVVFTCVGFGFLHWGNGTFGTNIIPCNITTATITETVCESYIAPSGQIFNSSGIKTDTIPNMAGCDSIITINLTVTTVDITTTMVDNLITSNATGATYQWINCSNMNSIIVGETNQNYTITDTDSYAVVVTQNSCSDTSSCVNYCFPTNSAIAETVCGSYTSPSGQVHTESGTYTDIIINTAGCDSTITINLTVNTIDVNTTLIDNVITATANGSTFQWIDCANMNSIIVGETNQSYTAMDNNSYAVIITQNNCSDTSVCVNFCFPTTSYLTEIVCDSYVAPSGQLFTSSEVITDTIYNVAGCDSIITINLTVNTIDTTTTMVGNVVSSNALESTYQWINCSTMNDIIIGETNQNYSITDNDSYAVIITQGSCSDTSSCVKFLFSGIENKTFGTDINMYPNPTQANTIIDLESLSDVIITVTDITGKQILSIKHSEDNQVKLNTASFTKGVYFVIIKNDANQLTLKLTKQ